VRGEIRAFVLAIALCALLLVRSALFQLFLYHLPSNKPLRPLSRSNFLTLLKSVSFNRPSGFQGVDLAADFFPFVNATRRSGHFKISGQSGCWDYGQEIEQSIFPTAVLVRAILAVCFSQRDQPGPHRSEPPRERSLPSLQSIPITQ
jgi:hypothetical protein